MNTQALLHLEQAEVTYARLRRGMALLAFSLPVVLRWGGEWFLGIEPMTSMSAYYHSPMGDVLVGTLCAVGAFLFLYKGFSWREDRLLNVAGICAAGVALFPVGAGSDCAPSGGLFSAHGVFAVIFFAAIAVVCIFYANDGPRSHLGEAERGRYEWLSRLCGGVMALSIGTALVYFFLLPDAMRAAWCGRNAVFWIEAIGVWAFSAYWVIQTLEYDTLVSWLPWRQQARAPA